MKRVLVALFALTVAACSAEIQDPSETTDQGLTTATTRYPIVLVHGFLGNGEGFASFDPSISQLFVSSSRIAASLPEWTARSSVDLPLPTRRAAWFSV